MGYLILMAFLLLDTTMFIFFILTLKHIENTTEIIKKYIDSKLDD